MNTPIKQETVMHDLALRWLEVAAIKEVSKNIRRITLTGAELNTFVSLGPADHVKVFFADPETGVLTVPVMTDQGISRPETGVIVARDYTPRALRAPESETVTGSAEGLDAALESATGYELDIDFVLHGDNGPASAWATKAQVGDKLAIAGPRGSKLFPSGIDNLVVLADETAFPAAARWLEQAQVPTRLLAIAAEQSSQNYFTDVENQPNQVDWFFGENRYQDALSALKTVEHTPATFFFLAGEATGLIPMRRYLRRELGLPKQQVEADGYWKQGITNLDHHAPLDPEDPDN